MTSTYQRLYNTPTHVASRLHDALTTIYQDEILPNEQRLNNNPGATRDSFDTLLENWDTERLNPRSCTLRTAVLVKNGAPTGEKSLAQISSPAIC